MTFEEIQYISQVVAVLGIFGSLVEVSLPCESVAVKSVAQCRYT